MSPFSRLRIGFCLIILSSKFVVLITSSTLSIIMRGFLSVCMSAPDYSPHFVWISFPSNSISSLLFVSNSITPLSDLSVLTATFISTGLIFDFRICFISSGWCTHLVWTVTLYLFGFASLTTDAYCLLPLSTGSSTVCTLPSVGTWFSPIDFGECLRALGPLCSLVTTTDVVWWPSACFFLQLCISVSSLLTFFVRLFISLSF